MLAAGVCGVLGLEGWALAQWQGWLTPPAVAALSSLHVAQHLPGRPGLVAPALALSRTAEESTGLRGHAAGLAPGGADRPLGRSLELHYAQLRSQMRWVDLRFAGQARVTPDVASRLLLAKEAARQARLEEVGLGFADVYGIINAETTWVPRTGASKDGTPNLGIAQFEPATARALGLRNPDDMVESVHVAALHMKEAAQWSAGRLAGLALDRHEHAARLREGVSVYYNLSSKGRRAWNGRNTHRLPRETQLHIRNARAGARQALLLEARWSQGDGPRGG